MEKEGSNGGVQQQGEPARFEPGSSPAEPWPAPPRRRAATPTTHCNLRVQKM